MVAMGINRIECQLVIREDPQPGRMPADFPAGFINVGDITLAQLRLEVGIGRGEILRQTLIRPCKTGGVRRQAKGQAHETSDLAIGQTEFMFEFRCESFNTFNHTQFSTLSTQAKFDLQGNQVDPLFLEPTAARSPRRVQLALRLNF